MHIVFLLEVLGSFLETSVEELAEGIEIVDAVDEQHEEVNLLFIRKAPCVVAR